MPTFVIPSVFKAVDKFSSVVKTMSSNVSSFASKAENGIARAERGFRKFTPALGEVSKQFLAFASTAAIVSGITAGIVFSFDSIKQYDKALGSLQAITGLSGDAFESFRSKIGDVSRETKSSTIEVAKAFELIGSANSKLLESADAMALVTKSAILLSQASGDDLASSASSLVGVMNQFNLSADQAERTMNVLAAGAKVGAATIPDVAEAMKNFGSVAASANISVEESVALVEVLSQKSVFGAEAGTKLRGSILKLQAAGVGYKTGQFNVNEALETTVATMNKLKTAKEKDAFITKMFGAENVSTGKILLGNIAQFKEFTVGVTGTSEAIEQAAKNNATLDKKIGQLTNAFVTLITDTNKTSSGIELLKTAVGFLTDNLSAVLTTLASVVGFFVLWKVAIISAKAMLFAYNVVLGVYNAIIGRSMIYTAGQTAAMNAQIIVTKAATAANWLFNASNPVGWIIILIGLIATAVINYEKWGAAMTFLLGPFGFIINLVQAFRRNWDMITESFANGGILSGLKAIGKVLLDSVLMPMQQLLELVARVTGSDMASKAAASIASMREDLGVDVSGGSQGGAIPAINPEKNKQDALVQKMESTQNAKVQLDVNDKTGRANISTDNSKIVKIKSTSTTGFNRE